MIIRLCKFDAVVFCTILIIVSFVLAFNYEQKPITASSAKKYAELPVIMYHHITENRDKCGKYTVLTDEFENDLSYIKKLGYTGVTVEDLINYADGKSDLPSKPIMITFDDGFESFYALAYPIAKKHNIKTVVSVIGSATEKYSAINDHNISYSNMTFEQIKKLTSEGLVEIQNHSYDMHKSEKGVRKGISKTDSESEAQYRNAISEDLEKLQKILKDNCNITPVAVAYPYGAYSKTTTEIVKNLGFRSTFLCEERINVLEKGNSESLFNLGRYNRPSGISSEEFFENILKQ